MDEGLKNRILTGVVLVILLVLSIVLLPTKLFIWASLLVIVGLGTWEWARLTGISSPFWQQMAAIGMVLAAFVLLILGVPLATMLFIAGLFWCVVAFLLSQAAKLPDKDVVSPRMFPLAALVLFPFWFCVINLHAEGKGLLLFAIALVAVTDIGAYFSGKRWGHKKLAPSISPGKTTAGLYGGIACAVILTLVAAPSIGFSGLQHLLLVLWATVAAVASVLGDLFESWIKRQAGVKDSGHWLPGHGGILDRLDGLSAGVPVLTIGMLLIRHMTP